MGRAKKHKTARKIVKRLENEFKFIGPVKKGFWEWVPILGWFLKIRRLKAIKKLESLHSLAIKYAGKEIHKKVVYGD